jgi:hypothetical protein
MGQVVVVGLDIAKSVFQVHGVDRDGEVVVRRRLRRSRVLVYTKAPQIIRTFDEGAVIRSRRGRLLAIPTENAPRKGTDGRRISPSTFPEHRASGRCGSCLDPAGRRSWSSMACEPRSAGKPGCYEASAVRPNAPGTADRV